MNIILPRPAGVRLHGRLSSNVRRHQTPPCSSVHRSSRQHLDTSQLEELEVAATKRALEYWVLHWDRECPTLFGLSKEEFQAIADTWPKVGVRPPDSVEQATVGAWRELLFGASAIGGVQLQRATGIDRQEAEALIAKLALNNEPQGGTTPQRPHGDA